MGANLIAACIGYVLFALFVGFLAISVAAPPLMIIIAAVLAMCLYDFVRFLRVE